MPTASAQANADKSAVGRAIIDCDVHALVPSARTLFPYLSDFWRETVEQTGFKGTSERSYPASAPTSNRPDATTPNGVRPGTELAHVRAAVLDRPNVEVGILNCAYAVDAIPNPYAAEAFARATNDWLIEHWLDKEPRLRASIVVPSHYPDLAAAEIDRVGNHPGFVQVFLPARSERPYGNRRFLPVYEAALRHDLVVSVQFGGSPGVPPTAGGWPSHYVEEYVGMAQVFQSQLMNIVVEGVFDRFPDLRMTFVEAGWTWLPAFLWRFDKEWKALRREVPWVKRPPTDYILEHVRFTLQPIDAPPDRRELLETLDQIPTDDVLLYSSDYPHWHDDGPAGFPFDLPEARARKILAENARAWYRL